MPLTTEQAERRKKVRTQEKEPALRHLVFTNPNQSRPRSGVLARRAGGLTALGLDGAREDEDSLHESTLVGVISQ
jgi:hypothetical protein